MSISFKLIGSIQDSLRFSCLNTYDTVLKGYDLVMYVDFNITHDLVKLGTVGFMPSLVILRGGG